MSATVSRTRKAHRKSKAGCITCKTRKVKCDETRPSCHRCVFSGRRCDGYPSLSGESGENDGTIALPALQPCAPPWSRGDREAFDFYRAMTCRALHGTSESENGMWHRAVPQMAMSGVIPVRYALCAIGSLHRHTIQESAKLQQEFLDLSTKQYNLALSAVASQTHEGSTTLDIAMICSLLFTVYESFRGRQSQALMHIQYGSKLLRSTLQQQALATSLQSSHAPIYTRELVSSDHFQAVFHRFVRQLKELGSSPTEPDPSVAGGTPMLTPFTSIDQASIAFEQIYLSGVERLEYDPNQQFSDQATHAMPVEVIELVKAWCMSMDAFTGGLHPQQAIRMARPGLLGLMVYRIACKIALGIPPRASEMIYDRFLSDFEDIVTLCEGIMNVENSSNPKFGISYTTFIVSPCPISPMLYLTCWRCRDPATRKKALALLEHMNTRDGLWDSAFLACLASGIIEGEEKRAIELSPQRTRDDLQRASDIPEGARLHDDMPLGGFTAHPIANDLVYHYEHIMNKCHTDEIGY